MHKLKMIFLDNVNGEKQKITISCDKYTFWLLDGRFNVQLDKNNIKPRDYEVFVRKIYEQQIVGQGNNAFGYDILTEIYDSDNEDYDFLVEKRILTAMYVDNVTFDDDGLITTCSFVFRYMRLVDF